MKTVKAKMQVDRPVTETLLDEAIERGQVRHTCAVQATTVTLLDSCLVVRFEDGSGVLLPVKLYPEFAGFKAEDFAGLKVGFSGTALCHDTRDVHVSIAGMISASESLMTVAASVIASRNGRQSSAAKAEAARANGKKGGRPRKVEVAL
ncbi:DUF2442 domain-containing protein [Pseudomonas sp. N3-W]|uniref:DUF2442 domain-containing protein n=1 Tax=Pseudomonas sp. N3-W TaxID=2975049 RepID=UPI00217EFF60|nr:DUF2442 domain-containing protein [Pseudomonas sp. N3-W]UWF48605.1 DUF2442 domain-containing protein [Pseudomonas sp. N3-W]